MNVGLISKYRAQLMGIAVIIISIFHSSIVHTNDAVDYVCFIGDMGVDIFFFLSGLGMYYALRKNPTLKEFYWKRIVRIVPVWFVVNLYVLLDSANFKLQNIKPLLFFKLITGLSFWLDCTFYFWYIPAQLMFYFITPLFMKYYRESKRKAFVGFGIIWLVLVFLAVGTHNLGYCIFLFRWPVYFCGIWFGELCSLNKQINQKQCIIAFVALIGGFLMELYLKNHMGQGIVRYEFKYIVYFICVIPLCILVSLFLEKLKYKFLVCKFLGGISLEVYLLHEFVLKKCNRKITQVPFDKYGIIYNLLVFAFVVILSVVLHKMFTKIQSVKQVKER
ncbi:MAG: acyltransferase [Lachnospiraceae bacterium]|nr:acyltransferase [Lachnospiraceae bacterium]